MPASRLFAGPQLPRGEPLAIGRSAHAAGSDIIKLGLIDTEPEYDVAGKTYRGLLEELFGAPLEETIPAKLAVDVADSPVEPLRYIGMLSDESIGTDKASMLDLMADCMAKTLANATSRRKP